MLHPRGAQVVRCALALLASSWLASMALFAGDTIPEPVLAPNSAPTLAGDEPLPPTPTEDPNATPGNIVRFDEPPTGEVLGDEYSNDWGWTWAPTGLIYHSYMAGPQEPRAGAFAFSDLHTHGTFADATLGGRMGFLQYGNGDPVHPAGFQVDFYGAAIARLDLESQEDLVATDYVFGLPFTYGNERWQMKLGYAHLSSHIGDEFAITNPGALANRVNYVRDSIVWGNSYYVVPAWRIYGEMGWAFHHDGGAGPWDAQFGTEISPPGPTGGKSVPFLAINGRLRDDDDFGSDLNLQTGFLRRGILGQTLRYGLDYYIGKSSQSSFFNESTQQIGGGLWYDF
jgi:hypothetical protein